MMGGGRALRAGVLECVAASDGELRYPPAMLFANARPDELAQALGDELTEDGTIAGRLNPLLVRGQEAVVLVDTGFGRLAPGPGAGRLVASCALKASSRQASMWSS